MDCIGIAGDEFTIILTACDFSFNFYLQINQTKQMIDYKKYKERSLIVFIATVFIIVAIIPSSANELIELIYALSIIGCFSIASYIFFNLKDEDY